ncbi:MULTISPECIES: hypothetical protein [Vibrio]|jgi:hypothetical protein|nr:MULTISPECIES: hypothetical protein [Vibrio]BDP35870.1 hypothetical protein VA208B3_22410 [Vibrio alginolyticus]EGQ8109462.1 hypothetical protein [Vibrio parahaemolyticus]ELU8563106.1 hypothetical protein [Vibrio parahaemolyticus]MDG2603113.1 hypothetical protein [Vibrio parahaemolyticus]MEA5307639.1 hypothetical protein [Vibrio parahaemolyticus]
MIKPTVLFLLILGISGYFFLNGLSKYHFKLKRTIGYHTFFESTAFGLLLFVFASVIHIIIQYCGRIMGVEHDLGYWALSKALLITPKSADVALFNISLITLILGFSLPKVHILLASFGCYNSFKNKLIAFKWASSLNHRLSELKSKIKIQKDDELRKEFLSDVESPEFSRLIDKASELSLPILFTMSDSKVYIGYPYEITGGATINDLLVIPLVSGYRSKDKNKLEVVTRYIDVVQELRVKENIEFKNMLLHEGKYTEAEIDELFQQYPSLSLDSSEVDDLDEFVPYLVSLPYREIVHAHIHNLDQYELFRSKED